MNAALKPTTADSALNFLAGIEPDQNGRTLAQYRKFTDKDWDGCHDVVQWAFPTRTVSAYNPYAPILPDSFNATVEQTTAVSDLFANYLSAMNINIALHPLMGKLVQFSINPVNDFIPPWVRAGDHNYKRFSRIIECLNAFGLTQFAEDFHDWLVFDFAVQYNAYVDAKTVAFWTATWQDKRHLLKG